VSLGPGDPAAVLPPATLACTRALRRFIAESPKSARAFLKAAGHPLPLRELRIATLNEHTPAAALTALIEPVLEGEDCGLLSEAGCPAVADPGAALVRLAHERGVRVTPLVGPSAILLALMGSGLNGQSFAFHGYLPVETAQLKRRVRELEEDAARTGATQIFIETPYRNGALLKAVLDAGRGDTLLSIATDLTLPGESIATRTIAEWKKEAPAIDRRPTVFALARAKAVR
jgi:16S rRNA (cytidine1402-2'-O)-methyltransferase